MYQVPVFPIQSTNNYMKGTLFWNIICITNEMIRGLVPQKSQRRYKLLLLLLWPAECIWKEYVSQKLLGKKHSILSLMQEVMKINSDWRNYNKPCSEEQVNLPMRPLQSWGLKAQHVESNSHVQFHPAVVLFSTHHNGLTLLADLLAWETSRPESGLSTVPNGHTRRHNCAVGSQYRTDHPSPGALRCYEMTLSLFIVPTIFMPSLLILLPHMLPPHLPNSPRLSQPPGYALDPPLSPAQNTTLATVSHSWVSTVSITIWPFHQTPQNLRP